MHYTGAAAEAFISSGLLAIAQNPTTWRVVYWNPESRQFWLKTYPHSEWHGGGPADLDPIGEDALSSQLVSDRDWATNSADTLVRCLFERWCDRRCVRCLRELLQGWPHNGLTDGVADCATALERVRALGQDDLTTVEEQLLQIAISAFDRAVHRR